MAAERRLAAIVFTDIVGYTALSQQDEPAALRLLQEQDRLVQGLLQIHRGRKVKSIGDGLLLEFPDALDALACAVDLQRHLHERNARMAGPPLRVRVGVHVGDVEGVGGDILGDAVNIAARIMPVAEPGGVCVSAAVREQVWNKVPERLEALPPKALKGLRLPMDLYRVVLPLTVGEPSPAATRRAGLAVLPFANISPDPKDEYFADGLTEELITALSHMRDLRVIARTSVMQYKAASKPVSQIGTELGVASVLEGSVRKAGNRLRITAQLIDVGSEGHVWAETYDRDLDDVFAVQADISKRVAEALKIGLRAAAEAHLESRSAVRSDSYMAYLRGRSLMHDLSRPSIEEARKQFELAISLDPKNAAAYAGLADAVRWRGSWEDAVPGGDWDREARRSVARAVELDPDLPEAHASLGLSHWDDWEWTAAEKEFELALALNPSHSLAHHWFGLFLEDLGRADEALAEFTLAEAADPLWPLNLSDLAALLTWLGQPKAAQSRMEKIAELEPDGFRYHSCLAHYHFSRSDRANCAKELRRCSELLSDPLLQQQYLALYHVFAGEPDRARAILLRAETTPGIQGYSAIAWVYAILGDLDGCFRWLEIGLQHRLLSIGMYRLFPGTAHVRADPRFGELLRRMNLG